MPAKKTASVNFETALSELDAIVKNMEQGGLSLEESLQAFEKGVTLTRQCQEVLKDAEHKVKILSANNLQDFTTYDNEAE
jgi:exodeoxyribonuclease VII small subunit